MNAPNLAQAMGVPSGIDPALKRRTAAVGSLVIGTGMCVFGIVEAFSGTRITAGLDVTAGLILLACGIRLILGGCVQVLTHVIVITVLAFVASLLVLSGGTTVGVLIAAPLLAFLFAILETRRWAIFSVSVILGFLILAEVLRRFPGDFPLEVAPTWIQTAPYRVSLLLCFFSGALAYLYRAALETAQSMYVESAARHKAGSAALLGSRRRLEDFATLDADWFWETDNNGRLTYLSEGFVASTGLPIKRGLGRTPAELFVGDLGTSAPVAEAHLQPLMGSVAFEQKLGWDDARCHGGKRYCTNVGRPFYDETGKKLGFRGVVRDVTETRELLRELQWQASRDELTGTYSRHAILLKMEQGLKKAVADGTPFAIALIDLDGFKPVNDQAGHGCGDRLLASVAQCIRDVARPALCGRIGGDEFLLLIPDASRPAAVSICESVQECVREATVTEAGREYSVTASIGLVIEYPVEIVSAKLWLRRADHAVYEGKSARGDTLRVAGTEGEA